MERFIEENSAAPETFDAFRDFIERQTLYAQWEAKCHELGDEHPDSVTAWDEWGNTIQWVKMRKHGTTAEAKAYAKAFGKADELWHRYHTVLSLAFCG